MKTYQQFITELFNEFYSWKWSIQQSDIQKAKFETDQNTKIGVLFEKGGGKGAVFGPEDSWEVTFGKEEKSGLDVNIELSEFNASKIITTVIEIMNDFIKNQDEFPDLAFSALKGDDEMSRPSVYRKLIDKKLPSNYQVTEKSTEHGGTGAESIIFILEPKE